jgi:hypothetical protein
VIAALDDATAGELRALSNALTMAGGVFAVFAAALSSLAVTRADGVEPDAVDELSMRLALRRARNVLRSDAAAMGRLEAADEPFWIAVRDSLP